MKKRLLAAEETRSRIRAAFEKAARTDPRFPGPDPDKMKRARSSLIRSLPAWVGRFGLLAGPRSYCLWCEPIRSPRETFPSQMIFDVPPGRFMIEILDSGTLRWMSRESAEGGPLVAGLPYPGNPLLVWIRIKA